MSNNDDLLKELQSSQSDRVPTATPSNPNPIASAHSNNSLLDALQETPRDSPDSAPARLKTSSTMPATPPETNLTPSVRTKTPNKAGVRSPWTWVGITAAAIVGVILTLSVGMTIFESDTITNETGQVSDVDPENSNSDSLAADQGPPLDIPALAAQVTASTVFIECSTGIGSGFILDVQPLTGVANDNIIVTNQHVIEGCEGPEDLTVSTATSVSYGSVVNYDRKQDLAIIEAPDLVGDSLTIGPVPIIGQWAMAVGNPIGITDTVTFGNITNVKLDEGFMLSDVLIGPGNSGGPLVNNQGQILGVNTAVLEDAQGFSISVPIRNLCDTLLVCR